MIDLDIALSDLIGPTTGRGRRRTVLKDLCEEPLLGIFGFEVFDDVAPMRLENPGPGDALR